MTHLVLRLCESRTEYIVVPEGQNPDEELTDFLERKHRYAASEWVELKTGEHVRYDQIVSVRIGD